MPTATKDEKKKAKRKRRILVRDLARAVTPTRTQQPDPKDDGPNPFTGR